MRRENIFMGRENLFMGRENHAEIHRRKFEKFYSDKPNVCYFFETVDSFIFGFFLKTVIFFTCMSHAVK